MTGICTNSCRPLITLQIYCMAPVLRVVTTEFIPRAAPTAATFPLYCRVDMPALSSFISSLAGMVCEIRMHVDVGWNLLKSNMTHIF